MKILFFSRYNWKGIQTKNIPENICDERETWWNGKTATVATLQLWFFPYVDFLKK